MKPSLSVILPVRNRQSTLVGTLTRLVEVLPDLTPRWDMLIVLDGSTDATPEVAVEFSRAYPQVAVVHQGVQRGDAACFHWGARMTRGEVTLFRDEDCDLDLAGIHKMWHRIATHELVVARSARASESGRRRRVAPGRLVAQRGCRPVLQMIRRRAIEGWLTARDGEDLQLYLARRGYPQQEVALAADNSTLAASVPRPHYCDQGQQIARPKAPNYLTRLRSFAWGE